MRFRSIEITISGSYATLNEFIDANRRSKGRWNAGNEMKRKDQKKIVAEIRKSFKGSFKNPIHIRYRFFEPNRKRDLDNVSGYFHKVFQDALVDAGAIPNDNWKWITGFSDEFFCDKREPRIEVMILETEGSP